MEVCSLLNQANAEAPGRTAMVELAVERRSGDSERTRTGRDGVGGAD
jgi:hypothetical protein